AEAAARIVSRRGGMRSRGFLPPTVRKVDAMSSRMGPRGAFLGVGQQQQYQPAPNAALLIDFDNVTMAIRSDLGKELKALLKSDVIRGKVAVQRAFADWRRYPQYIVPLTESSVDLIFAPAY